MRKLAYTVTVDEITPIEGADRIELARLMGWRVVVIKDQFKVGQKAVFFEIDSFLPIRPEFEFLRKSSYRKLKTGEEGFRLRTIKLRGQISQGLLLPLSDFGLPDDTPLDTDLTEQLKVQEWDDVAPQPGAILGGAGRSFPAFIPKTDEERVQTYKALDKFVGKHLVITEKVDGSSLTVYYRKADDKFGVCSRNRELDPDDTNAYWEVVRRYGLEEKMRVLGKDIALQGEMFGAGIQKNPYKMKDRQVLWFSAYDITKGERLNFVEMNAILGELMLSSVPVIFSDKVSDQNVLNRDYWISLAEGKSVLGDTQREGIVVRIFDEYEYSFKAISNKYLLSLE